MKNLIVVVVVLTFISACKTPEYLPKPEGYKQYVKGSFFNVNMSNGEKYLGEIIAVDEKKISLLSLDDEIIFVSKTEIESAKILVSMTSEKPKAIVTAASLINLTSIGHGYYGVITLPINILATTGLAVDVATPYSIEYPEFIAWDQIYKFARFPQGVPQGIKLNRIH